MTSKILLFCPVRQDPGTLDLVLESHANLKGVSERWYYNDNDDPRSVELLSAAAAADSRRYGGAGSVNFAHVIGGLPEREAYHTTGETHQWTNPLIKRMATIRNFALDLALGNRGDFDAVLIVDSDLVLPPDLALQLDSNRAHLIVSTVFWSQWRPGELWMPNVWDFHPCSYRPESVTQLREPGIYQVGGLGACTLIRRPVLENLSIRYDPITGLENLWGEDRWFSVRASCAGVGLYADTHVTPFHVYRREQLEEARRWYETGASPDYFREVWLTKEWASAVHHQLTPAPATSRRLALCLPGELFSARWMMNMLDAFPKIWQGMVVKPFGGYASDPSMARQAVSQAVLEDTTKFDYLLWIDDDNVPSYEQIALMVKTLETYPKISMVAGWCHCAVNGMNQQPENMPTSCGFFTGPHTIRHLTAEEIESAGALVEVDWTGFPAVLMRGELLEKVGWKAFQYRFNPECQWGFQGEDVSFSRAVAEAGGKIVVDPRLKVPHMKLQDANPATKPIVVSTISPGKERANSAKEK